MNIRNILEIIEPKIVIEGAGVRLRRSIFPHRTNLFDPFLLFDHFIFQDPIEGPPAGFPYHPHRGIETVTYMLEGSTYHRDSLGNTGTIGPGDIQWMTSGRGILHEEMPRKDANGRVDGFQLWVNLPKSQKMIKPQYQEVRSQLIPQIHGIGTTIKLIAGNIEDAQGPIQGTSARPLYLDLTMQEHSSFTNNMSNDDSAFAYIFEGSCSFSKNGELIQATKLVHLEKGEQITIYSDTGARLILASGAPFGEPIVPYGPFVMNTKEEIQQALLDLRQGTFVEQQI
jgi:hypothetical protein